MIGTDHEVSAIQIVVKMFHLLQDGKQLSSRDAIMLFRFNHCTAEIRNHPLLVILNLRQDRPNALATGIGVQNKDPFSGRIPQDRRSRKCLFQLWKCCFTFSSPSELIYVHNLVKRTRHICEALHKATVIGAESHETPDFLRRPRSRPISDGLYFSWVSRHTLAWHQMSQILNLMTEQFTFCRRQFQLCLFDATEDLV